jgi:Tol biopolymer transport system component/DNA-binding winged helix-turn-helix (wHTH) protein
VLKSVFAPDPSDKTNPPVCLGFGLFVLDLATGELTKSGRHVDIQGQPLRVITVLAQNHAHVVTREQMRQQIWAEDTYVDFESGLRTALKKARQALGDDAAHPRFIETLPRRGFRFIAPVSLVTPALPAGGDSTRTREVMEGTESPAREMEALISPQPGIPSGEISTPTVQLGEQPRFRTSISIAAFLLVAAAASAWMWSASRPKPPILNHLRLFAAGSGRQNRPSFSPNGDFLAFDWKGPHDDRTSIYIQKLDSAAPFRLTSGTSEDFRPVWSGDGSQVAFLRAETDHYSINTINLVDHRERHLLDFPKNFAWFDWSADAKWLVLAEPTGPAHQPAIMLISAADGRRRAITSPPPAWRGDTQPVFSPDASQVAFRRITASFGHEDVYVVPTGGGEPVAWTFDNRGIGAFTFLPGGGLLISSQREGTIRSLWWVALRGGDLTQITPGTADSNMPAVSRNGKHFAFSRVVYDVNVWRVATEGDPAPRILIDSAVPDGAARFSPDRRRIAFQSDRSGNAEIWVCDADGANPVRLTNAHGEELGNPEWSPDGTRIAFEWHHATSGGIYAFAPDGGDLKSIAVDSNQYRMPTWSRDGRFIYSVIQRSGQDEIWKAPVNGGSATSFDHIVGRAPRESPNGKSLFFFRDGAVWRVPLSHGAPTHAPTKALDGLLPQGDWGNWDVSDHGIYYIQRRGPGDETIDYLDLDRRSNRILQVMPRSPVYAERGLALSADGKFLLYSQVDQNQNQIFVQ